MRKILFIIAVFSFAFYSCENDGQTDRGSQDSALVKNDSVAPKSVNEI